MYHEGDIKPVVKRVRPYKTLLINLPAKSFGFWVLANTKIEACLADEKYNETENIDDAVTISEESNIEDLKAKRSINVQDFEEYSDSEDVSVDFCDVNEVTEEIRNKHLKNRVKNINKDLGKVEDLFKAKSKQGLRTKRQTDNDSPNRKIRKFIRQGLKNRNVISEPERKPRGLIGNILQKTKFNITKLLKGDRLHNIRNLPIFNKNKLTKRQSDKKQKRTIYKRKENLTNKEIMRKPNASKQNKAIEKNTYKNLLVKTSTDEYPINFPETPENKIKPTRPQLYKTNYKEELLEPEKSKDEKLRTRRNTKDQVDLSAENEVDINVEDNVKLWKMLRKIHKQFKDLSEEADEYVDDIDTEVDDAKEQTHTKRLKNDDDDVELDDDTTFVKKTVYSLLRVISDLNKNLNRFWNGIRID